MRQSDAPSFRHQAEKFAVAIETPWSAGFRLFQQCFPVPIQQFAAQPTGVVFICQFNHGIAEPFDVHYRHGPIRQDSLDHRIFTKFFQSQNGAPPLPVQILQSLYFIREEKRESCPYWKINDAHSTQLTESILDSSVEVILPCRADDCMSLDSICQEVFEMEMQPGNRYGRGTFLGRFL